MTDATITTTLKVDGFAPVDIIATVTLEPETTPEPPEPTPGPEPTGWLTVEIDYEGTVYTFHEDGGTDLGDYTDPHGRFIQSCGLATHPDLPGFRVMFRPDVGGDDRGHERLEVVFELGDTTPGAVAANVGAYTATVLRGEVVLARIEVPEHYWYSRWRWQSAPRPITGSIAQLQADGLLPRFDTSLATTRPLSPVRVYEVMGLAGLTAYMPSTGERDEIGLVTEAQAEFIRGDATVDSLIAQAEASGTFPWHYRNETGGAVFDFKAHPQATLYGGPAATIPWIATPITLDCAHEPSLGYLPFLLTGDPYYLEEMQFAATYNVLAAPAAAREKYCIGFAVRAHAWALRALAHCARVTPEVAPAWIKPRGYWQDWLDGERDWMLTTFVHPTAAPYTAPPYTGLHFLADTAGSPASATVPAGTVSQTFMEEYEAAVLGHVVQIGFADWQPILEWKLQNTLARTSGVSGWVRAKPVPYNTALRATDQAPYVADWESCWSLNVAMQPDVMAHDDPDTIPPGDSLTYASYAMSALAMAATLGIAGAVECHAWLRGQIATNSDDNTYIDRKWTISG